jgi:simple sugar transport system ATP-binding protein
MVLFRGAQIPILDEPTAVQVPQEVDELFGNLRELKRDGVTMIFISHKLDEVLAIADTITVVRAGTTIDTVTPAETSTRQLAELMVGSELPFPEKRGSTVTDQVELSVEDLTVVDDAGRVLLDHASFRVRRGEILGIAGVEGNGQDDLIDALLGIAEHVEGRVEMGEAEVTHWPTRRRRESGLGYIPQDRHREGLLLSEPLWENAMLGHQGSAPYAKGIWIDRKGARRQTEAIIAEFDVRTPGAEVPAYALSGGNQQKLIVGREMKASPSLLIAAHPTRGIDVGAQAAVWERLREARADGLAVLLVSADLDELIGLSDTLCVIHRGQLVTGLDPATVTAEDLGCYMTGTVPEGAPNSTVPEGAPNSTVPEGAPPE